MKLLKKICAFFEINCQLTTELNMTINHFIIYLKILKQNN